MRFHFKKVCLFAVLIFFIVIGSSYIYITKQNNNTLSKFKQINVVLDDNYPPFVFRDDHGNLNGILVDEWNLWSIKTGIKVSLYGTNWDNALNLMNEGNFDVIDTIFENKERDKYYDFTKAYTDIEVPIVFNSKLSAITDVSSLNGFKVGVKKGDNSINLLKEKGINDYLEFNSYEDIVKAAKDGKVDVFIIDKPPALYYIYKYNLQNDFKFTTSQYAGQFHRAVKKDNSALLKAINLGFSKINQSEEIKIYNKWFGFQYVKSNYTDYYIVVACISLICLIFMVFFNIILNNRVKQKTTQLTEVIDQLTESEDRINAIFKVNPDTFLIINRKYEIEDCKIGTDFMLINNLDIYKGNSIYNIFTGDLLRKAIDTIKKTFETNEMQILEYSYTIEDEVKYFESRNIKYSHHQILAVIRDITDKKQAELKLYNMSIKDAVTGLYNRNYFQNSLNELNLENTKSLAIIMCDLDGLKFINDTFGHAIGDAYLKTAGKLLKKSFAHEKGIIARIGGDEFAIILKDVTDDDVLSMKDNLNVLMEVENKNNSNSIPLSMSIGYSLAFQENINIKKMIKEADDWMYREKLHNKQSKKNDLVKVITKMLEARDFITEGHCDRLQSLAVVLAKRVGLCDRDIQDISLLCKFHDIGKIGISDTILFKRDKLTAEEYEEMKKHTEIGYRIAQASPDIAHLSEFILKHHEWWNGDGYPFGLSGEDIPIQCRILAIADAYDAMVSDRPYRNALSKDVAINEIIKFSGIQFEPFLVNKFVEIIKEI